VSFLVALPVADAISRNVSGQSPEQHFYLKLADKFLRLRGKVFGIAGKNTRTAFHQHDARFLRTNATEIVLESLVGNFGQCTGQLEACGAGADDDKVEPGLRFLLSLGSFSALECVENLAPHRGGFLNGLDTRGACTPLIFAVVRGLRAGGHDQRVVGETSPVAEDDAFGARIKVHSFAKQHFNIFLTAKYGTEWRGNLGGRERAGGYLIEQRLKEMEIALIEKGDVYIRILQGLRGNESSEAAS